MAKKALKRGDWTPDEVRTLKKKFRNQSTAEVAAALNRPLEATKKKASRLKLRKTKKYLRSLGLKL